MLRIIILLSTWVSLSYGCLACSYGDIKILTHLYLNVSNNTLKSIDVEWTLDPMFSQMVLGDFDLNRNGQFEPKERAEVYGAIVAMKEVGYFIRPVINNKKIWLKELKNFTVRQEKGLVIYHFTIPTDEKIGQLLHLTVNYDENAAFNNGIIYHLNDKNVYLIPPKSVQITTKLTIPKISQGNAAKLTITLKPNPIALASPLGGNIQNRASDGSFSQSLRTITEKIHGALVEAKEHPSFVSIGAILLFSLLYGILHAAGPGHGKTLVASYFSTNERSYGRGITVALLIAATHVVSAFVITMILYWFVHTMFSQTITDVSLYMTKFSGLIVLGIAVHLARQKWLYYRTKPRTMSFSTTVPHISSCGCHSCKTTSNSSDLMLILGAGIVPCPGTIVVFLFTISMGMYALGALSALVMSLGMGLTIALTAALGTALRRKSSSRGEKTLKIIDVLGVSTMLLAGVFLLLT
jgi:nickel/cobalt transporter (NicO) family protein